MSYVLMELTKVTDRVDALENDSNDDNDETKSVGAVNIEFTGEFLRFYCPRISVLNFLGLSDLIQARSHGNVVEPPSVDPRITQEGFILNFGFKNWTCDINLLNQK